MAKTPRPRSGNPSGKRHGSKNDASRDASAADSATPAGNDPTFDLTDFVQEADSTAAPEDDQALAWLNDPDPGSSAEDDEFTWFQDAVEEESEDVAAWGSTQDPNEPFVWFQEPVDAGAQAADVTTSPRTSVELASTAPAAADSGSVDPVSPAPVPPHPAAASSLGAASDELGDSAAIDQTASAPAPTSSPATGSSGQRAKGAAGTKATKGAKPSHFRPEIEGLRAVAVFMIVVYHVWLGRVSGGVDVFLFISAFLLGSSFARRLDAGRTFAPVKYWLRTFTRLMPPAVIAISGSLVAAYFLLPPSAWQNVITHAIASATYVQNIVLSSQSVDYYALDASQASPLQHFWSLSLQGQVFLTWPLLFMFTALLARRSAHPRRTALGVFGTIAVASFAYSVWFTATNQSAAYFSTPARLWEVSAGTILALTLPRLDRMFGAERPGSGTLPGFRTARAIAGWTGFALLVSLGLVLDVQGSFPGWIAIWPLAGAALIIIAGFSGSRWGFDRVLTMKLPRALASSSYSLYLVHWPILIFWLATSGRSRAGWADGLCVIAGSMAVAWVLSKLVDAQFRSPVWKSAPPLRSLAVIGLCLAVAVGGASAWRAGLATEATQAEVVTAEEVKPAVDPLTEPFNVAKLAPKGHELGSQWPVLPHQCEGQEGAPPEKEHVPCETLKPLNADSDFVVIVVGSSHSRQFIPALMDTAKKQNWQIINLSMDGCAFADNPTTGARCQDYFDYAMAQITRIKPDLVVTTATAARPASAKEAMTVGGIDAIRAVRALGIDVLAFRDNPRWSTNAYQCAEAVIEEGGTPEQADATCGAADTAKLAAKSPLDEAEAASDPTASAASDSGGAQQADAGRLITVDLTDRICPDGRCSPILGNRYVYMDNNHLTRAFTTAVAPDVSTRLADAKVGATR